MSVFISRKALLKENREYRRSSSIMKKTRLPTQVKTKRSICPRCSKKGYSKELRSCIKCKFVFSPESMFSIKKASEI
jgi:hypothetical protein